MRVIEDKVLEKFAKTLEVPAEDLLAKVIDLQKSLEIYIFAAWISPCLELKNIQRNTVGPPSYVKVTCVLMFSQGFSVQVISNSLGIDSSTAYHYLNTYISRSIDPLLSNDHKGYWGMLDSHQLSALREELKAHVYADAKSVSKWAESALNVACTVQGVIDLLNRIGFTYKKTKEVPCEADANKQQQFAQELSVIHFFKYIHY